MEGTRDGRPWQIGTQGDTAWIAGQTSDGSAITVAIPQLFDAYATCYEPDGIPTTVHEQAVVRQLVNHTKDQPWWLGYLDTGAHDIVFTSVPKVSLYWNWDYVLVQAGPEQALTWRTGHMRSGTGSLPDLFFPADRSWLVSALWDDTWTCIGGSADLINALHHDPLVRARQSSAGPGPRAARTHARLTLTVDKRVSERTSDTRPGAWSASGSSAASGLSATMHLAQPRTSRTTPKAKGVPSGGGEGT